MTDNSIEARTARKYPREAKMADRLLDYIEDKDYSNAIEILMSMSCETEPTDFEGISEVMPRTDSDIDLDDIQMLIIGAMAARQ